MSCSVDHVRCKLIQSNDILISQKESSWDVEKMSCSKSLIELITLKDWFGNPVSENADNRDVNLI